MPTFLVWYRIIASELRTSNDEHGRVRVLVTPRVVTQRLDE
jgi:hypothetical protein